MSPNLETSASPSADSASLTPAASTSPATASGPPTPATSNQASTGGGPDQSTGQADQSTPQAYTPNFKFKVMDKEYEIPEFLRAAVKDPETEKQLKELHEKAFGLDVVKPKYQEIKQAFTNLQQEYREIMSDVDEAREYYRSGDMESFFKKLGMNEEKVLQYFLEKAQYQELPPDQRQIWDERKNARRQAMLTERQLQAREESYREQIAAAKAYALQVALEKPDVKQYAKDFDARVGRPNAFLEAVIEYADTVWIRSQGQIDVTPDQAIKEVMTRYGNFAQSAQNGLAASSANTATSAAGQKEPPVIPNLGGGSKAPASKQKPKSIAELKQLAAAATH